MNRAKFTKNMSCLETCGWPTSQDNQPPEEAPGNPGNDVQVLSRGNSQLAGPSTSKTVFWIILDQEEWAPLAVPHVISSRQMCWFSFYKMCDCTNRSHILPSCHIHIVRETYCLDRAKFTKNMSCLETCGWPTSQDNQPPEEAPGNPGNDVQVLSRGNSQLAGPSTSKTVFWIILDQEEWAPLAVPHVISSRQMCWFSFLQNLWLYKS